MSYHLNRIFSAGIVWDPSEPLPPELQDQEEVLHHHFPFGRRSNGPSRKLNNLAAHVTVNPFVAKRKSVKPSATWPTNIALPTFAKQEHGRNVLPPQSVTVDTFIVQDTARVAVNQHFYNDSTAPIKEAAFTFPLPAGCTITDFSFRIGANKIIKGTVKPREEAREAFERHIRHHDTAAGLLEQDTPEIFTTSLGNIPEKTRVEVSLNYITLLKHRFAESRNVTTLTLPTYIAPRYGDAPEDYNNAATSDVPQGLTLNVEIVESERITSIASPSHAVSVERRSGARIAESFADLAGEDGRSQVESASVKLQSGCMFLDKDFVLDIMTAPDGEAETPQAWLEAHPILPNQKALMLTLPSGYLNKQASKTQRSEILFVADRSGSMEDKIASLKSSMQFFLKGIPEGRKFNIWSFGSEFTSWQPHSVDYGEATLKSAVRYVDKNFAADMGGTELLPAIVAIISARDKALMTDVIVLTDGQTWRMDQTLEYIQKTRLQTEGRVRFFALGIGEAVSHALVDGIAKAGGGYAEVVQEASYGGWEDRVVSMAKAALMSSHLGPLHIEFKIQDGDGNTTITSLPDAQRSPADVSVVSPFDRSRIYFLFDTTSPFEGLKEVKVDILANGETKSLTIPIVPLEKPDATIHKLAARSMLEDLERGRSHIHLGSNRPVPGSWDETNKVRKEAEKIACKWGLVSKWTSLFLVDEPAAATPEDATLADGVVEVKDAPGEDLLEPRGATQPSALAGSANVLTGGLHPAIAQSSPGDTYCSSPPSPIYSDEGPALLSTRSSPPRWAFGPAGPPLSYHTSSRSAECPPDSDLAGDRGRISGGSMERVASRSPKSANTREWQSSPGYPRATGGYAPQRRVSPELYHGSSRFGTKRHEVAGQGSAVVSAPPTHYTAPEPPNLSEPIDLNTSVTEILNPPQPFGDSSAPAILWSLPDEDAPKKSTERDLIHSLLQFQQHDGSINFGTQGTARNWLGEEVWGALRLARKRVPDLRLDRTVLWTAAVYVLLERDFQSCKSLWELMVAKMESYCRQNTLPGDSNVLDLMRKSLGSVKLPIHQKKGESDDSKPVQDDAGSGIIGLQPGNAPRENQAQEDVPQDGAAGEPGVVDGDRRKPEKQQKSRPEKPRQKGLLWYLPLRWNRPPETPPESSPAPHLDPVDGGTPIPEPELPVAPPETFPFLNLGPAVVGWDDATPIQEPEIVPARKFAAAPKPAPARKKPPPTPKPAPAPEPVPAPELEAEASAAVRRHRSMFHS